MSSSVLLMSISADGYIAGPNDRPDNPGGDDFMRLHEWYLDADGEVSRPEGEPGEIWDDMMATGAVVVGRRTAEQVDYYGGDHHGVPLFVVSHDPTPTKYEQVRVLGDVETAMAEAKAVAGDKNVLVHGAVTARSALAAGVLDELQLSQIPVLFGSGMRLFDVLPRRIELEVQRVIDTPHATHIRYRVVK